MDNGDHLKHPCYKSTVSSVIHEIIHREVTTNMVKMNRLASMGSDFAIAAAQKSYDGSPPKLNRNGESTLDLSYIRHMLSEQLDQIEADRFISSLTLTPEKQYLSFADV